MSYIVKQTIKGQIYLYEAESYWDSEKKQSRQRRKYLGKLDPDTQEAVTPRKLPVVSSACEYGHLYFLRQIAERIGLVDSLRGAFGSEMAATYLSLASFQVLASKPWYLYEHWSEELMGTAKLTSQKISTLLQELGSTDAKRNQFFHHWAKKQQPLKGVWLDITSISSYSQGNSWVEWGYNRDKEPLPQVNLGVLLGNKTNLPFFYELYPGSIPDVSTLNNIALRTQDLGFDIETWVMDRGFYSASNLENLKTQGYHFITAMPASLKLAQSLLRSSKKDLASPTNCFCLGKEVLFSHDTTCQIGTKTFRVCVYLSEKRRAFEIEAFVRKLDSLEHLATTMKFEDSDSVTEWLNRTLKGSAAFYTATLLKDGHIKLKRKRNALSFRMNRMGKMILVTTRIDLSPKEILDQYRSKDRVEKVYDVLKNSLNEDRLRTHSSTTMHGQLFITFLSLIIQTAISNELSSLTLRKTYTVPEIFMELKKIRLFSRSKNQPSFLSEISKKQRTIFSEFNIPLPDVTSLLK